MKSKLKLKLKGAGRKRRAAGWTLLTLGVLVAGVWVMSGWWEVTFSGHTGFVMVTGGQVGGFFSGESAAEREVTLVRRRNPELSWSVSPDAARVLWVWLYWPESNWRHRQFAFAFWPIPLLLWTPAALLLRSGILARRRANTGACPKCGYTLAGLGGAAACPECGNGAGTK